MYRYRFYLRSGHVVTLNMTGPMEKLLLAVGRAIDHGQQAEDQWLSEPGYSRAVRWTDIEGWEPDDIDVTGLDRLPGSETLPRVTTDNPNIVPKE